MEPDATAEPIARVWTWGQLSDTEAGRDTYVRFMSINYLRAAGVALPKDLLASFKQAAARWKAASPADGSAPRSEDDDRVDEADLPWEARLDADDRAVIEDIARWPDLTTGRRELLQYRLAIAYAAHKRGSAPQELVSLAIAVVRRLKRSEG